MLPHPRVKAGCLGVWRHAMTHSAPALFSSSRLQHFFELDVSRTPPSCGPWRTTPLVVLILLSLPSFLPQLALPASCVLLRVFGLPSLLCRRLRHKQRGVTTLLPHPYPLLPPVRVRRPSLPRSPRTHRVEESFGLAHKQAVRPLLTHPHGTTLNPSPPHTHTHTQGSSPPSPPSLPARGPAVVLRIEEAKPWSVANLPAWQG